MNRVLAGMLVVGMVFAGAAQAKNKSEGKRPDQAELKKVWTERLGLTEAQADKLEAAFQERRKAVKPLRRELRDALTKLHDQVEDEAGDEVIKTTLDRLKTTRSALQAERDKFQAKVGDILPPSKQAKLLLARGKMARMHAMERGPMRMRLREIIKERRGDREKRLRDAPREDARNVQDDDED
jgi:Spy/CpxP family protein refolding chaperone